MSFSTILREREQWKVRERNHGPFSGAILSFLERETSGTLAIILIAAVVDSFVLETSSKEFIEFQVAACVGSSLRKGKWFDRS